MEEDDGCCPIVVTNQGKDASIADSADGLSPFQWGRRAGARIRVRTFCNGMQRMRAIGKLKSCLQREKKVTDRVQLTDQID